MRLPSSRSARDSDRSARRFPRDGSLGSFRQHPRYPVPRPRCARRRPYHRAARGLPCERARSTPGRHSGSTLARGSRHLWDVLRASQTALRMAQEARYSRPAADAGTHRSPRARLREALVEPQPQSWFPSPLGPQDLVRRCLEALRRDGRAFPDQVVWDAQAHRSERPECLRCGCDQREAGQPFQISPFPKSRPESLLDDDVRERLPIDRRPQPGVVSLTAPGVRSMLSPNTGRGRDWPSDRPIATIATNTGRGR